MNLLRSLSMTILLVLMGCNASNETPNGGNADGVGGASSSAVKSAVLGHLAEDVIVATLTQFQQAAVTLNAAAVAHASAPTPETLITAQEAWREAMEIWQQAEVMQVGPAGVSGDVVGGEDMRDSIYSWPLANPCRIDQELVEETYLDANTLAQEAVNTRGLDALEYLYFVEGTSNACKSTANLNIDGSWSAIEGEVTVRRAAYASACTELLLNDADVLLQKWTEANDGFASMLAKPNQTGSVFGSQGEALNAISDALFYIDKTTKDQKLAQPVGLNNCDTDLCLEALESPFATRGKEHIIQNLKAAQMILEGAGGAELGMSKLLREVGADTLADDLSATLSEAIAKAEAIPGTMADSVVNNPNSVIEAHTSLTAFTTLLKTQFIAILDLQIPARAASDSD